LRRSSPSPLDTSLSRTPLIYSPALSDASHCNVFLKLENTQPSGSFKSRCVRGKRDASQLRSSRGVGHLCHLSSLDHRERTHLVISSGGNAALAVAHAARMLRIKATACVHVGVSEAMRQRLRDRGCEVRVAELEGWEYADRLAREVVAQDPCGCVVRPVSGEPLVTSLAQGLRTAL
jgi:L-serine/L-threonine ammonia-lyase